MNRWSYFMRGPPVGVWYKSQIGHEKRWVFLWGVLLSLGCMFFMLSFGGTSHILFH